MDLQKPKIDTRDYQSGEGGIGGRAVKRSVGSHADYLDDGLNHTPNLSITRYAQVTCTRST